MVAEFIAGPDIYYNRARYYDPVLGKFIAEDPLGFASGDTNLYAFAWSNPRNWKDPSGLSATAEEGSLTSVVGASLGSLTPGQIAVLTGTAVGTAYLVRHPELVGAIGMIGVRLACNLFAVAAAVATGGNPDYANCSATADGPQSDPKQIPLLGYTPRGGCTPDEKKKLHSWYKDICNSAGSCKGNFSKLQNEAILAKNVACLNARAYASDVCFGGKYNGDHLTQMEEVSVKIGKCRRFIDGR